MTTLRPLIFSTLDTTIPHDKLKSRLKDLITHCFFYSNGKRRYIFIVLGHQKSFFVEDHSDCTTKFTETDIVSMLEFLLDNIFVVFDGQIFQQTIGIPMGTNCVPLLADLFLYSYEEEFIQGLLKSGKKKLAQSFNFTYRHIDDVLSLGNSKFSDYLDFIYPSELEIKGTTEATKSTSYLDCLLEIDNSGKLFTKLYDKRDDFNFPIVNFPILCGNTCIPASPAYGVFVSQLIRHALYIMISF